MGALSSAALPAAAEIEGGVPAALLAALEARGAERPLCAVIEDVHLADSTTLAALSALADKGAPPGVLLVLTGRPSPPLADLARRSVQVPVKPLLPEDTHRLLRALGPGLSSRDVAALVGWAPLLGAGNPLYSTYCVRALEAEGALRRGDDGLFALDERRLGHLTAPETVAEAVDRLLDKLAPDWFAPLGAAALLGKRFGESTLLALGAQPSVLRAALPEAMLLGICAREGHSLGAATLPTARCAGAEGTQYWFEHATVRRRLASRLSRPSRRALHARVAQYLEDSGAPPGACAFHWERATERYRAARAHLAARRRAERLGAASAAVISGERARRLFLECGRERVLVGRFGAAASALEHACSLAEEMDARADLARASALLAISLGFCGEHCRAVAMAERARELSGQSGDPSLDLVALCATSAVGESSLDPDLALRAGAAALQVAGAYQVGGEWLYLAALFAGRAQFRCGHLERARLLLGRAIDAAEEFDLDLARGWAYAFRGDVNLAEGRLGEAVRDYRLAAEAGGGDEYAAPLGYIGLAHAAALRSGSSEEIALRSGEALVRLRAARNRSALVHALQRQAESLELIGRPAAAVEAWRRRDAVFEELGLAITDWWPPGYQISRPRIATELCEEPTVEEVAQRRPGTREQTMPGGW
jgi:hypothetical protein